MSTPITGSVLLTVQGLQNSDNSIIFNRIVTGLQGQMNVCTIFTEAQANFASGGATVYGFYVRNQDASAVLTISFTGTDLDAPAITVEPNGVFLIFSPSAPVTYSSIAITSTILGSRFEFAIWS